MSKNIEFFKKQNICFEYADKNEHKFIIAKDIQVYDDKTKKLKLSKEYYSFKDYSEFLLYYKTLDQKDKIFNELVSRGNTPFYEFYDLDLKLDDTNKHLTNSDLFFWFVETRANYLETIDDEEYSNCTQLANTEWYVTTSTNDKKLSLHILNKKVIIANNPEFKIHYKKFEQFIKNSIDKSHPFKDAIDFGCSSNYRFMRLCESTKISENRPLKQWTEYHITKIPIENTFISIAYLDPEIKTKLVNISIKEDQSEDNKESQTISTLEDPESKVIRSFKSKDEYIYELLDMLEEKYYNKYIHWIKICFALKTSGFDIEIFKKFSKKSPKYNEKEVESIWNSIEVKNNKEKIVTIGSICFFANESNPEKYKQIKHHFKNVNNFIPFEFTSTLQIHQKYISEDIYSNNLLNNDIICLKSNMNTGKTYCLPNIFPKFEKIIIVYHRISLNENIYQKFKQYGFHLYSDIKTPLIDTNNYKRVIIQIDSIHRLTGNASLLILDEIESTFNHIITSDYINKNACFNTLKDYIYYTPKIITCDANLKNLTVNLLKQIRQSDKFICIENTYKSLSHINYTMVDSFEEIINTIRNHLNNGKKIVIPSNSKTKLKMLTNIITSEYPTKKYLYIDSEHKCTDYNWEKWDIVLFTPSITCGVSFDKVHFDACIGVFSRLSCNSEDISQMLIRVRNYTDNQIFINVDNDINNNPLIISDIDVENYIDTKISIGCQHLIKSGLDFNHFTKEVKKNEYYHLFKTQMIKNNTSFNSYKSYLVNILTNHGMNNSQTDDSIDTTLLQTIKQTVKIERIKLIENTLQELFKKENRICFCNSDVNYILNKKEPITSQEKYGIKRFLFENVFDKLNTNYSFDFLKDNYKYTNAYKQYKKYTQKTIDESISLSQENHEKNYNTVLENINPNNDNISLLLSDDCDIEDFDFNYFKKMKDVNKTVQHNIHYNTIDLKVKECLQFVKHCGFNIIDDNTTLQLDYTNVHNYCKNNEEMLRSLFNCKKMEWKKELDSKEKIKLSMYINHKLENILGISIGKINKEGRCKEYKINKLFKLV
jgi:hypothetical protein